LSCAGCGLVVSPAIWAPQANESLEEEWFGEGYEPVSSFWVRGFEAWNNRRTMARLAGRNLPGRRLLEIGVGSGSFLRMARHQGFDVTGCDLSPAIARRVGGGLGIEMHCGPLSDLAGEARFDVIVMNHVLEHVTDPPGFLRDVSRLLVPDGIVHVAVPNVDCWEARLFGWTSYEPYHLLYFTPATLQAALAKAGFSLEAALTHESFSGWFLALLRTALGVNRGGIGAARGSQAGGLGRAGWVEHAYRLAMLAAGVASWPVRWLQSTLARGDEAIAIARKPGHG